MKSKKIHVLFASRAYESPQSEGGFVLLRDLAREFSESKDFQATFFSAGAANDSGVEMLKIYQKVGWGDRCRLEFLLAILRHQSRFDIVHIAHVPTLINVKFMKFVSKLGKRSHVRYIQTITAIPKTPKETLHQLFWGDKIICQTNETLETVLREGLDPVLISPRIPPARVRFDQVRRRQTRKFRFSSFSKVIVYPGEYDRLGIDETFSIFIRKVLSEIANSCVVLACRFDESRVGENIIMDCSEDYPGRVFSMMEIDWIVDLLEAADLVVFPARSMEGKFQPPLVLLEALALGRKVLVSEAVDLPKHFHSHLVYRASAMNFLEFANAAINCIRDLPDEGPVSDSIYEFDDMVERYQEIYLELANREL